MIRKIQLFWKTLGIKRKLSVAFGSLVMMIVLVFSIGYLLLHSLQNKIETSILNNQEVTRMILTITWKLEESRSVEKDFFLQYPIIGFTPAYNQFVKPALDLALQVNTITAELGPLLEKTQIQKDSNNNLELLFMAQQRHVKTLNESTELVATLVDPENGLEPKLFQNLLLLKKNLEGNTNSEPLILFQKMQTFTEFYMMKRQRPIMQSSFNVALKLRDKLDVLTGIHPDEKEQALSFLDQFVRMGEKIIEVDVTLRGKKREFQLQAHTLKTISNKMLTAANQLNEKSKKKFIFLDRIIRGGIFSITIISLVLLWIAANLLGNSITRPITTIAGTTRDFEKGNLETRIHIDSQDELGELADSYNQMAARMKDLINTLEQKILDRTKHLNDTLQKLQKEVAEHQQAELALQKSESRFRDISQSMADWIWEVDENNRYTYVSETVKKILGYSSEDLIGKTPFEFMPSEEKDKIKKIFNELVLSASPIVDLVSWYFAKDGTRVCILKNGVPIIDADGKTMGYRGVDKDITEQKKLEAERGAMESRLQQAQKMESIGTLAGGIAHDFNNILYPIIGFAEMSIEDLPENHPVKENLEDILQGAKRARDLVNRILLFSRQKDSEFKPLLIQPVIEETLKLIRATIPANIEIKYDLNEDSGYIFGNTSELHEIVMNLCTNAYHAMEEQGGTLEVSLKKVRPDPQLNLPAKEYCCLTISDTGTGIAPELIDHIFEPYFTTKTVGKGTGLGLSVIHGIVKNHKGAITVKSRLGKGSTFYIYLPLSPGNGKPGDKGFPDKKIIGGDENILFIDDEEPIVKIGIRILERLGYKVTGRTNSTEALTLFVSEPDKFDLVITDMAMPGMVGTEFAKRLMDIRPDIPIIICTGFSEQLDHKTTDILGIRGYLHKPILINELSSKVRDVLDHAKIR